MLQSLKRTVKNSKFEQIEVDVREATSNSKSEPSSTLLNKISLASVDNRRYCLLWQMLWKRITDEEQARHVIKGLNLLDYLLRVSPPSETVQSWLVHDLSNAEQVNYLGKLARKQGPGTDPIVYQHVTIIQSFLEDYRMKVKTEASTLQGVATYGVPKSQSSFYKPSQLQPHTPPSVTAGSHQFQASGITKTQPTNPIDKRNAWPQLSPSKEHPQASATPFSPNTWTCALCTFLNPLTRNTCEMCLGMR